MPRTLIRDLEPNRFITGVFSIHNNQLGMTKGGKPFIKCLLGDKSGRTPGRMWNASEQLFETLPTDGFVYIEGQTQPYQGELQIIIQLIKPAEPEGDDLYDLLPSTDFNIDDMFDELVSLLDTVKHKPLRYLIEQYVNDEELMERFRKAPAAVTMHHAFIGGLLEHTLQLMKIADAVCPLYPKVSRDLVIVGLFLHDLGKTNELQWDSTFTYSDRGQLIGHIVQGALWLQEKAKACAEAGHPIDEELLMLLQHIVLSHHGVPEFGAAKLPGTPEALLVSHLDNLDAKMNMAVTAARGPEPATDLRGNFTEKVWALETRLYKPDPTLPDDD